MKISSNNITTIITIIKDNTLYMDQHQYSQTSYNLIIHHNNNKNKINISSCVKKWRKIHSMMIMMMIMGNVSSNLGLVWRSWSIWRNKEFSIMGIKSNSSRKRKENLIYIRIMIKFRRLYRRKVKNDIVLYFIIWYYCLLYYCILY